MKSTKILGVTLAIFAVALLFVALGLLGNVPEWLTILLLGLALIAFLGSALLRTQLRSRIRESAKRYRASLLKHIWEERHHREW